MAGYRLLHNADGSLACDPTTKQLVYMPGTFDVVVAGYLKINTIYHWDFTGGFWSHAEWGNTTVVCTWNESEFAWYYYDAGIGLGSTTRRMWLTREEYGLYQCRMRLGTTRYVETIWTHDALMGTYVYLTTNDNDLSGDAGDFVTGISVTRS